MATKFTREIEEVYKIILNLNFLAMAEEFKWEPEKREQIIRAMTRVIRKEQNDANANKFYALGMEAIKK